MKPILELESSISLLENAKVSVLQRWVSYDEALAVLQNHGMSTDYFKEYFASSIFDYYICVVKKEKEIGDCPVMAEFLNYMKEHDVSASELFLICTHFRKSMIDELFEIGNINRTLFDEVSYVFDLNFSGVLDQYAERLYKAQREIKLHQRRFEEYNTAIDQSAMVCKVGLDGLISYVNTRFCELSGFTKEELIGTPTHYLRDENEINTLVDEMWEQLNNKEVFHETVKNIRKDGTPYYTELTIVPMLDLEGEIEEYLCIQHDVSELVDVRDAALQAERTKDRFLANMSHEIRTPLNAILGFVSILKNRLKEEEDLRYLDIIDSSGKNLMHIIADILDFAKIREGKLNIDAHMFNPTEELSSTLGLFRSKSLEKNIEYLTYIDPNIPMSIKADSVRVKQILSNLLSNAVKFTPQNGRISVTIECTQNKLDIRVKDNGCGMDEDAIQRVFSEFEQAEDSTTRKYGGTGLGLSICQSLSEMMNGEISVESALGEGSTFRLLIPVEKSRETNSYETYNVYLQDSSKAVMQLLKRYLEEMKMCFVPEASAQSLNFYDEEFSGVKVEPSVIVSSKEVEDGVSLVPSFNAYEIMGLFEQKKIYKTKSIDDKLQFIGHILIAEDNHANQMFIKIMLEEYGLTYVVASNGQEAYEKFQQEKFDLVLMDEQMPVMGGVEAAAKIMEYEHSNRLKHTPIISVTANALKEDRERFLAAGMDGYIAKPIESAKLEEVLSEFIPSRGEKVSQKLQLPSYANISAEEMASKIGLNVKHIPILVQSFIKESQGLIEQLEAAIAAKDYDRISNVSHSIKGSSGNLKFTEMYELAKEMELSAKDRKEDYCYADACESIKTAIGTISL